MSVCYIHSNEESVVTCAKCGVGMCKECEANAFLRTHNGTGQPLCNRCSLTEIQAQVDYESAWLTKRLIKLIICAVLVVIGLGQFLSGEILTGIICWFIAGLVSSIGVPNMRSVEDVYYEYHAPISTSIGKIIGNTILGPISVITNFIGYMRTKAQYKKDLELLEVIKTSITE